jgi:hypothetical protein
MKPWRHSETACPGNDPAIDPVGRLARTAASATLPANDGAGNDLRHRCNKKQTGASSVQIKQRPTSFVACHKCAQPVVLATTERLPSEFSLRCERCLQRGFYLASEIRQAEGAPARATIHVRRRGGLRKAS